MRKLASIQTITDLFPIPGADNIEAAQVLGWTCVVKKNEFKVGDKIIFFEVDSVLPEKGWSKFMEPRKYRVKTIRLKKQLSQGLVMPLSILDDCLEAKKIAKLSVGDDVTETLGVKKFEIQDSHSRGSNKTYAPTARPFPSFIPKTDEIRLQSVLGVLDELKGKSFYISLKYDGCSATYARKNGNFWACSRNRAVKRNNVELVYEKVFSWLCRSKLTRWLIPLWTFVFVNWTNWFPLPSVKNQEENPWWAMADKYSLEKNIPEGFAIQGEICGPGIQGNKLNLIEKDLFVFNVFDIDKQKYLDFDDFISFCKAHKLNHVQTLDIIHYREDIKLSLDSFLKRAKGKYPGTQNHREGIVIRPLNESCSDVLRGRLSFKVINNDFLLKYDE